MSFWATNPGSGITQQEHQKSGDHKLKDKSTTGMQSFIKHTIPITQLEQNGSQVRNKWEGIALGCSEFCLDCCLKNILHQFSFNPAKLKNKEQSKLPSKKPYNSNSTLPKRGHDYITSLFMSDQITTMALQVKRVQKS